MTRDGAKDIDNQMVIDKSRLDLVFSALADPVVREALRIGYRHFDCAAMRVVPELGCHE